MLNAGLLTAITAISAAGNVLRKEYNKKAEGTFIFNVFYSLFGFLFFFLSALNSTIEFSRDFIIYSLLFSLSFICADVFSLLAIREGPLSLTALIVSCSTMLPAIYGIIFLGEPVSVFLIIALVLLVISLCLINVEKKNEEKKITPKWLLLSALAFIGNGMCSIVQKEQQLAFDGKYKNEFMMVALLLNVIILLMLSIFRERKNLSKSFKYALMYAAPAGLGNGAVNLLVMILCASMAASVMFPIISAAGIITSCLIGALIYKEKFSASQLIGIGLGLISVILINF